MLSSTSEDHSSMAGRYEDLARQGPRLIQAGRGLIGGQGIAKEKSPGGG